MITIGFSMLFDEQRSRLQLNYLKDFHSGATKDAIRAHYHEEL